MTRLVTIAPNVFHRNRVFGPRSGGSVERKVTFGAVVVPIRASARPVSVRALLLLLAIAKQREGGIAKRQLDLVGGMSAFEDESERKLLTIKLVANTVGGRRA